MKGDFIYLPYVSEEKLYNDAGFLFLSKKHKYYINQTIGDYTFVMFSNKSNFTTNKIILLGTIIYKGLENQDALNLLIKNNFKVDWCEIVGNYTIIDFRKETPVLYIDPLRKFHIFSNNEKNILSSSFLATCHSSPELNLDKNAFLERLMRGYNIAPETLYKNIKQVYYSDDCFVELADNRISNVTSQKKWENKTEILSEQKKVLIKIFEGYRNLIQNNGADLGVSSGYDSRLILSILTYLKFDDIQLHSHAIKNVQNHQFERKVAKKLANLANYNLKVVETLPFTQLDGLELEKNIIDNWIYFDGRNSHNMGSLAPTYTSYYKHEIMGDLGVSINGLGGEIFRNYYKIASNKIDLKAFLENHLFYRFSNFFVSTDHYEKIADSFIKKINFRLGIKLKDNKISKFQIRRYYNEIRMPDGDGNNHNAHNKYFDFITPFIEPSIIKSTNGVEPFLGNSGNFEAMLIDMFNTDLSLVETHYGKSSINVGLKNKIKTWIIASIPQKIHRYRFDKIYKKGNLGKDQLKFKNEIKMKSKFVNDYWLYIEKLFPKVNWEAVNTEFAALANANMMAITVYEFRDKTNF